MRFDAGSFVPAEDSTDDPVNSTSIDNTGAPTDDDAADVLREVDGYHKAAREAIAAWFANAANAQRATVNSGSTEPARRIDDNTASRTAGPRKDRFSR